MSTLIACLALSGALAACGGGQADGGRGDGAHRADAPTSAFTDAADAPSVASASLASADFDDDPAGQANALATGAELNAQELHRARSLEQALRSEAPSERVEPTIDTGLRKAAAAADLTVFRFYNAISGAHFYTASVAERDQIRSQASAFAYEGPAFQASSQSAPNLSPVYRFFNSATGVHFYSISEDEKNHILQSLPQFRLEGVAYHASKTALEGYRPLYRAYVVNRGFHFYSISATEASGLPNYRQEGVAYYVVGASAAEPAPTPPAVDATCGLPNFQADWLQQVNAARAVARTCGGVLRPAAQALSWGATLQTAANRHSTDMAVNNFFSHTGSDGSSVGTRATEAGYNWRGVGENIAAGYANVGVVMNGWLASTGHCNNLMEASYTEVALACVAQPGTAYGKYWTMVLGRR